MYRLATKRTEKKRAEENGNVSFPMIRTRVSVVGVDREFFETDNQAYAGRVMRSVIN